MGFVAAVRACLGRYATFSGRARRPEYWWFVLFALLVGAVASAIDSALGADVDAGGPVAGLTGLVLTLPALSAAWRRLHDVGRTGWAFFLPSLVLMIAVAIAAAVDSFTGGTAFDGGVSPDLGDPESVWPLIGIAAPLTLWAVANLLLFYWLVSPSQPGPNRFGPEPPAA